MSGSEVNNNDSIDRQLDEEEEKDDETRAAEDKAAREAARKRCYKYPDPPKVYTDVKVRIQKQINSNRFINLSTKLYTNSRTARGGIERFTTAGVYSHQRAGDSLYGRIAGLFSR